MSDFDTRRRPEFRDRARAAARRMVRRAKSAANRVAGLVGGLIEKVWSTAEPAARQAAITQAGLAQAVTRRVIAYGMDEGEIRFASSLLTDAAVTPAFVAGNADDATIERLRQRGLFVETVYDLDDGGRPKGLRPETPGLGVAIPWLGTTLRRNVIFTRSVSIERPETPPDPSSPQVYLVQVQQPLLDRYLTDLSGVGVALMDSFQNGFYSAFLTPAQVDDVHKLDFVVGVERYDRGHTAPRQLRSTSALAAPAAASSRLVSYDIILHRVEDREKVRAWLVERNVEIEAMGRRKVRVRLHENSEMRTEILDLSEVKAQEEYVEPKLANDSARLLLNAEKFPGFNAPLDGRGQIIAVADTGLDRQHPDFVDRIVAAVGLGAAGEIDDTHGHGTHVAGSVLGSGAASGGQFRGVAPGAKLYFQSLQDAGRPFGGLPADLNDLLEPAYNAGARIHNNSWGADTPSIYTAHASEVDEFVSKHRDMLVVVAAGNFAHADLRESTPAGVVDWMSVASPATAKNVLTVGASRSSRTAGGRSALTWREYSPKFPDAPIGDESTSGDAESLAAFSGRGPSDDSRIKPDVVAPGTNIVSTRSAAAANDFWGKVDANPLYVFNSGTSMAAPLVAGCAAIVRQYYQELRGHKPSAALMRATIVNGTRWLKGRDANESNAPDAPVVPPPANYDQGFGCVDMTNTLPNSDNPNLSLAFFDDWETRQHLLRATGREQRFSVKVEKAGMMLRVCLAYTDDHPARSVQNQVVLFVKRSGGGEPLAGNFKLRRADRNVDIYNNVQIVRIADAPAGDYFISVVARNVLLPQDFALVVTGYLGQATLRPLTL
ncbi:MAG: S8 family serine peptidase [Xanthobacteraceae bacterium]|nr:S8 family serine peptidase [Xanthobacteraceae bacterium]